MNLDDALSKARKLLKLPVLKQNHPVYSIWGNNKQGDMLLGVGSNWEIALKQVKSNKQHQPEYYND